MDFYRPQNEKERKRRDLLTKIFIYSGLVLILIVISGLIYTVRYSNLFKIKNINVDGTQSISSDELVGNLKTFFTEHSKISGFLGSDNILAWGGGMDDFLAKYPQFESLKIEKHYFSKEINIEAREREKFGIWCVKAKKTHAYGGAGAENEQLQSVAKNNEEWCGWFDRNGIIFSDAPVIETEILNKVNDLSGRNISMGDKVLPDDFMNNLLAIFDVLKNVNVNTKTIYLNDFDLAEVETVSSSAAPKIYFSLKFDPKFSLAAINALKKSGEWKKINYVDFRVENRVYYR